MNTAENQQNQTPKENIRNSHTFSFPRGIIGFEGLEKYSLEPIENTSSDAPFLKLRCLENDTVSFIIMPLNSPKDTDQSPILFDDLAPWLEALQIEENKFSLFSLVTVIDKENADPTVTTNLRAPLLVNSETMQVWQIILDNPSYEIAYKLN